MNLAHKMQNGKAGDSTLVLIVLFHGLFYFAFQELILNFAQTKPTKFIPCKTILYNPGADAQFHLCDLTNK